MKVIRAAEMGMCFGVRDALQIADRLSNPTEVTVYGELVHNPLVQQQLSSAGFRQLSETGRDADISTATVMITAHGISDTERRKLNVLGKELVDTTCPLVRKAHSAAMELRDEGRLVLLIGKPGHVEVQGIVEDLEDFTVVERVEQVTRYASDRIGVVSQTTMPPGIVAEIVACIEMLNSSADIRFIDTICRPTRLRQLAMETLLDQADTIVVVGGKNSNNTHRLVQLCLERGATAFHVENAEQLKPEWFDGVEIVGLTAGTSTLDSTIDSVQKRLETF